MNLTPVDLDNIVFHTFISFRDVEQPAEDGKEGIEPDASKGYVRVNVDSIIQYPNVRRSARLTQEPER